MSETKLRHKAKKRNKRIATHLYSEPLGHAFCGVRVRKGPFFHTTRIPAQVTCGRCRARLGYLLTQKAPVLAIRHACGDSIVQLPTAA